MYLMAPLVKNPPAVWETWVQSLGCEDPLERGKDTHSSILAWRIPWTIQSMGHTNSDTTEQLLLSLYNMASNKLRNGRTERIGKVTILRTIYPTSVIN